MRNATSGSGMRNRTWLRALAVLLGLLTLIWIPVKLFTENWNAPLTPFWIAAALGVTVLPLVALGVLFLLVRKLANENGVTGGLRLRFRLLCIFTGPVGCVWSVFFLTRERTGLRAAREVHA